MGTSPSSCESMQCEAKEQGNTWWRLVWCHDRYQQQGLVKRARRRAFEDATAAVGASLLYLRKALEFKDWCCTFDMSPYILLTDWREAKPCMEIVRGLKAERQPVFMMVICEVSRERTRATRWAQSLSMDPCPPVYVHHDMGSHHTLVDDVCTRLNCVLKKDGMHPFPQLTAANDVLLWPASARSQDRSPKASASSRKLQKHPASASPPCGLDQDADPLQQEFRTLHLQSCLPVEHVADVLQPIWEMHSSNIQMEQLLRNVMPDVYYD